MRFLKFSIFILFLLSLSSAGATIYLATIRENERQKRIAVEQIKEELEGQLTVLEAENNELNRRAKDLEHKNRELETNLDAEREAVGRAMNLIREKDMDIEALRGQAAETDRAFKNSQKRNQELEKIIDELEIQIQNFEERLESVKQPMGPGAPLETLVPAVPGSPEAKPMEASRDAVVTSAVSRPEEEMQPAVKQEEVKKRKPRRRRGFFSLFRFGRKSEEKKAEAEVKELEPSEQLEKLIEETAKPQVESPAEPAEKIDKVTPKEPEVKVEEAKEEVREPTSKKKISVLPLRSLAREKKTEQVKPKVDAESVAQKPAQPPAPPAPKEETVGTLTKGRVLLINKKFNFIVINLGLRQGLALDDRLSVRKGGIEIAKARIEKIYDDYSAAYIIEEQSGAPFAEGDEVVPL